MVPDWDLESSVLGKAVVNASILGSEPHWLQVSGTLSISEQSLVLEHQLFIRDRSVDSITEDADEELLDQVSSLHG